MVNSIAVTATATFLVDTRVFDGDVSVTQVIRDYILAMTKECNLSSHSLVETTRNNASYMHKAIEILKEEKGFGHVANVGCLFHGLSLVVQSSSPSPSLPLWSPFLSASFQLVVLE